MRMYCREITCTNWCTYYIIICVLYFQDKKNALRAKEVVQKIKADSIINKSRPYVVVGTEIPPGGRRKGIFLAYQNLKFLTSK